MEKVNDDAVTYGGWVLGLLTVAVTAFAHWRKGNVDESALVLGKWKELVDTHQNQIEQMQTRINTLTAENTDLRLRLDNAETRIRRQDDEIAGLKRAIIQNSQSGAMLLGRKLEQEDGDGTHS